MRAIHQHTILKFLCFIHCVNALIVPLRIEESIDLSLWITLKLFEVRQETMSFNHQLQQLIDRFVYLSNNQFKYNENLEESKILYSNS